MASGIRIFREPADPAGYHRQYQTLNANKGGLKIEPEGIVDLHNDYPLYRYRGLDSEPGALRPDTAPWEWIVEFPRQNFKK